MLSNLIKNVFMGLLLLLMATGIYANSWVDTTYLCDPTDLPDEEEETEEQVVEVQANEDDGDKNKRSKGSSGFFVFPEGYRDKLFAAESNEEKSVEVQANKTEIVEASEKEEEKETEKVVSTQEEEKETEKVVQKTTDEEKALGLGGYIVANPTVSSSFLGVFLVVFGIIFYGILG